MKKDMLSFTKKATKILPRRILNEIDKLAKINAVGTFATETGSPEDFDRITKTRSFENCGFCLCTLYENYSEEYTVDLLEYEYNELKTLFEAIAAMSYVESSTQKAKHERNNQ